VVVAVLVIVVITMLVIVAVLVIVLIAMPMVVAIMFVVPAVIAASFFSVFFSSMLFHTLMAKAFR